MDSIAAAASAAAGALQPLVDYGAKTIYHSATTTDGKEETTFEKKGKDFDDEKYRKDVVEVASQNEAILYVHGFNNNMDECTARLKKFEETARSLKFKGDVVLGKWSSVAANTKDAIGVPVIKEAAAAAMYPADAYGENQFPYEILKKLEDQGKQVLLVAHSHGCRHTVEWMGRNPDKVKSITKIALLHPDVDKDRVKELGNLRGKVAIFDASDDAATSIPSFFFSREYKGFTDLAYHKQLSSASHSTWLDTDERRKEVLVWLLSKPKVQRDRIRKLGEIACTNCGWFAPKGVKECPMCGADPTAVYNRVLLVLQPEKTHCKYATKVAEELNHGGFEKFGGSTVEAAERCLQPYSDQGRGLSLQPSIGSSSDVFIIYITGFVLDNWDGGLNFVHGKRALSARALMEACAKLRTKKVLFLVNTDDADAMAEKSKFALLGRVGKGHTEDFADVVVTIFKEHREKGEALTLYRFIEEFGKYKHSRNTQVAVNIEGPHFLLLRGKRNAAPHHVNERGVASHDVPHRNKA